MARNIASALLATCALLFSAGCNKSAPSQYSRYYDDGRSKPTVAVVPVFNHSNANLGWDISDEFTYTICEKLKKKDKVFLLPAEKVRSIISHLDSSKNPFSNDITWTRDSFRDSEFVVFLDLVEHEEVAKSTDRFSKTKDSAANLELTMRVRVIDLREPTPRIILQEMVHDSHFIPRQFTQANFNGITWGSPGYNISPLGMAHDKLAKEISARVEDYISLAKSR